MLAASAFHTHRHEAAHKLGYLTAEQFDQWVRLAYMTHPLTKKSRGRAAARDVSALKRRARAVVALASRPAPPAIEDGAAGGAEVAPIMDHACPDAADVRKIWLTQPHRVRLAGRALLGAPLLRGSGRRREGKPEAEQRGGSRDRPELR
jgi:hypothetical protein